MPSSNGFAKLVREIPADEMRALSDLARTATWRHRYQPDRDYYTSEVYNFWEPCDRAFLLLLPPGGIVHRHNDELIKGITHHLVISTNDQCENWWHDGEDKSMHMKLATVYEVERKPAHWSFNKGLTDRVHLLVEYK